MHTHTCTHQTSPCMWLGLAAVCRAQGATLQPACLPAAHLLKMARREAPPSDMAPRPANPITDCSPGRGRQGWGRQGGQHATHRTQCQCRGGSMQCTQLNANAIAGGAARNAHSSMPMQGDQHATHTTQCQCQFQADGASAVSASMQRGVGDKLAATAAAAHPWKRSLSHTACPRCPERWFARIRPRGNTRVVGAVQPAGPACMLPPGALILAGPVGWPAPPALHPALLPAPLLRRLGSRMPRSTPG